MSCRITGTVRCVELADGPVVVSAHPSQARSDAPAAQVSLPEGPGEFALELPAGSWWIEAVLEQPAIPGAREVTAWNHDAVDITEGQLVEGLEIVLEVPETVR